MGAQGRGLASLLGCFLAPSVLAPSIRQVMELIFQGQKLSQVLRLGRHGRGNITGTDLQVAALLVVDEKGHVAQSCLFPAFSQGLFIII